MLYKGARRSYHYSIYVVDTKPFTECRQRGGGVCRGSVDGGMGGRVFSCSAHRISFALL